MEKIRPFSKVAGPTLNINKGFLCGDENQFNDIDWSSTFIKTLLKRELLTGTVQFWFRWRFKKLFFCEVMEN